MTKNIKIYAKKLVSNIYFGKIYIFSYFIIVSYCIYCCKAGAEPNSNGTRMLSGSMVVLCQGPTFT